MIKLRMSVFNETWQQNPSHFSAITAVHHAIWVQSGSVEVDGTVLRTNEGVYVDNTKLSTCVADNAQIIRFTVEPDNSTATTSAHGSNRLMSCPFSIEHETSVLRFDRVTFPANAVAYRHIHPGAGIRYLTRGQLQLIADDHSKQMESGQAWFEGANSPVKAVAAPTGISEFIRVMVLPEAFEGKPTLQRLNEEDADKPTLQTNHRYFDQLLDFSR